MGNGERGEREARPSDPPADRVPVHLAGFWSRTTAFLVDASLLLSILGGGLLVLILTPLKERFLGSTDPELFLSAPLALIAGLGMLAALLYFSLGESSPDQGTVGKKLLRQRVVDLEGSRISLRRAAGRFMVKILSFAALLAGVVMIGITPRKQAFHDLAVDTLVVENPGMDPRHRLALGLAAAAACAVLFLAVLALAITLAWYGMQ